MGQLILYAFVAAFMVWVHRKNACPSCGDQLHWVDPDNKTMPLTRCFRCEGAHRAYVRPEFHDDFVFVDESLTE